MRLTKKAKQEWINDEILCLMDNRRKPKNKNYIQHESLNIEIKKKIKDAKKEWLHEQCRGMKEYEREYININVFRIIKCRFLSRFTDRVICVICTNNKTVYELFGLPSRQYIFYRVID